MTLITIFGIRIDLDSQEETTIQEPNIDISINSKPNGNGVYTVFIDGSASFTQSSTQSNKEFLRFKDLELSITLSDNCISTT